MTERDKACQCISWPCADPCRCRTCSERLSNTDCVQAGCDYDGTVFACKQKGTATPCANYFSATLCATVSSRCAYGIGLDLCYDKSVHHCSLACTSAQYEAQAPSSTSNRICRAITGTCLLVPLSIPHSACRRSSCNLPQLTPTMLGIDCSEGVVIPELNLVIGKPVTHRPLYSALPSPALLCSALLIPPPSLDIYQLTAPTRTSDAVCRPVRDCTSTEFAFTAPTSTSNRVCALITQCVAAEYESVAPTATSDRTCEEVTQCVGATYVEAAATVTSGTARTPVDNTC